MNGKKVGIVTFHTAINYGVHLQAFSLKQTIQSFGYEAHVVDYRKKVETGVSRKGHLTALLRSLPQVISNRIYSKSKSQKARVSKFRGFDRDYLSLTDFCECSYDVSEKTREYMALVCGSDQIWNPGHTHGNSVYFCGNIAPERRIAYAPSFGVSEIDSTYRESYAAQISMIPYLSARETTGSDIIKALTGRDSLVVVDPTMLLDRAEWDTLIAQSDICLPARKYVLCYILGDQSIINGIASLYDGTDMTVVNISQHFRLAGGHKNVVDLFPGVQDFLKLFKNAEFIYTDSYHGAMFSVIFRKMFRVFRRSDLSKNLDTRIESFLSKTGLTAQLSDSVQTLRETDAPPDYQHAVPILDAWIDASRQYLAKALSDIYQSQE